MNVSDAIKTRRTIRGFKQEEIPEELLIEILTTAQCAPSNCNTQPWHMSVVSGEARKKLEKHLIADIQSGKESSPFFTPGDANLQGIYKDRQFECAMSYYGTMGIAREDKEKRQALMLKNWEFFDAPHVGFISMPKTMREVNAIDIGIYLQTLMLLFVEHGIGSCPQGALAAFPDPIREIADIPKENAIICGISFGYPKDDALINKVRMKRSNLEDHIKLIY